MKASFGNCFCRAFLLLVCLTVHASAARLTGVMIFSCDEYGNPAGNFVWDTRGSGSDFYKVWLAPGLPGGNPDGLASAFINGPSWAQAPINIELPEGTHNFTTFFQFNGPWHFFALHLFFDDNPVAAISAKAPLRTGEPAPHFSANSAPRTFSMTSYPAPNAPAAGTTSIDLRQTISLSAYYTAEPDFFDLDRVSTHSTGANQRLDFAGTFSLSVGPSRPRPRLRIECTEFTLCWESELDRHYQVQFHSSRGDWTNTGEPVAGTGETICVVDKVPLGEGQRLYRLVELP